MLPKSLTRIIIKILHQPDILLIPHIKQQNPGHLFRPLTIQSQITHLDTEMRLVVQTPTGGQHFGQGQSLTLLLDDVFAKEETDFRLGLVGQLEKWTGNTFWGFWGGRGGVWDAVQVAVGGVVFGAGRVVAGME